ncbi:MAG: HPP family protein [SAR202 cluster bacterium]|nr:HPP family protein [SAR202 cluster bacterium]
MTPRRRSFLLQSLLAAGVMLPVLWLVDSFANAALSAGMASSVILVAVYPSGRFAQPRALVGGHCVAILAGMAFSLFLFSGPAEGVMARTPHLWDVALALSLGVLVLLMVITKTEHPPAGGTVLGMAARPWDLRMALIILGAVALLALLRWALRPWLRDLM